MSCANGYLLFTIGNGQGSDEEFGPPQKLFSQPPLDFPSPAPAVDTSTSPQTDNASLLVLCKEPTGQSPVSVVVNWPSMLKK